MSLTLTVWQNGAAQTTNVYVVPEAKNTGNNASRKATFKVVHPAGSGTTGYSFYLAKKSTPDSWTIIQPESLSLTWDTPTTTLSAVFDINSAVGGGNTDTWEESLLGTEDSEGMIIKVTYSSEEDEAEFTLKHVSFDDVSHANFTLYNNDYMAFSFPQLYSNDCNSAIVKLSITGAYSGTWDVCSSAWATSRSFVVCPAVHTSNTSYSLDISTAFYIMAVDARTGHEGNWFISTVVTVSSTIEDRDTTIYNYLQKQAYERYSIGLPIGAEKAEHIDEVPVIGQFEPGTNVIIRQRDKNGFLLGVTVDGMTFASEPSGITDIDSYNTAYAALNDTQKMEYARKAHNLRFDVSPRIGYIPRAKVGYLDFSTYGTVDSSWTPAQGKYGTLKTLTIEHNWFNETADRNNYHIEFTHIDNTSSNTALANDVQLNHWGEDMYNVKVQCVVKVDDDTNLAEKDRIDFGSNVPSYVFRYRMIEIIPNV